jgi:hypothetical protein
MDRRMITPSKSLARIVAGTYVEDSQGKAKEHPVIAWVQKECREGSLLPAIKSFIKEQQEFLDPALVLVESVSNGQIECVIPCRSADHESKSTFMTEVRFKMNPTTGAAVRSLAVA